MASPSDRSSDKTKTKKSSLSHLRVRQLLPHGTSSSKSRSSPSSPPDAGAGQRRASTSVVHELMNRSASALTQIHSDYVDPVAAAATRGGNPPEIRIYSDSDSESDDISDRSSSNSGAATPPLAPPRSNRSHSLTVFDAPVFQRFQRRKSSVASNVSGGSSGGGSTSNLLSAVLSRTLRLKK